MSGAGTTCICLSISTFLSNKLGRKTAYVELNTTNEIHSLSSKKKAMNFCHQGIDIYPCQNVTSLADILCMDYEYFILDMGVLNTFTAKEFMRCDKQFLVCSLSDWKKSKTLEKIKQLINTTFIQQEQLILLDNLGKKESKLSIFSNKKLKIYPFPYINNPFQLETFLFQDFTNILKGV